MLHLKNYINGEMQPAISGKSLEVFNPAKGSAYALAPESGKEDIEAAYQAASAAFEIWKNTPAEEKFKILNRIAEGIDARNKELAIAETTDQGKPLWLAEREMNRAGQNFRFFATAAMQFASESHAMEDRAINYTLRQPIGVVGCISPWNLPLYLFTWKIAPALAAGNCVIAKPSEITPVTAFLLGEICTEAGLPAGVLNIVHGYGPGCGQAIIEHPGIKAISFTGGTATGKHIAATAGPMFKKLSLELGGKNPNIIFDDCDFDEALKTTVLSTFQNQGEICLCGSRIFVQRGIYNRFRDALTAEVKKLKTGNPMEADTRVGAVASKGHFDKVMSYIELARLEGGKILCGGEAITPEECKGGWFISPTLIEELGYNCRVNQEEIFGPVATLIPFDTEDEVLTMANSTPYGLACSIWTQNLSRAHRVAAKIESGIVWINCWLLRDLRTPFGGMKQSGAGREGGWEAMRFFTEPRNICIRY